MERESVPMTYVESTDLWLKFEVCVTAKATDTLGCSELKQEQMQVVTAVLRGLRACAAVCIIAIA